MIQSQPNKQVLMIGLEASEPTLVKKWAEEGKLPAFKRLFEGGSWRQLRSTTEISSGATWASLITGTNPAKHGMAFYHRQLKPGTYTIQKKYAEETAVDPFWQSLSQNGKRTAVLDVPDSYVTKNLNGMMIVGWGAEGLNAKQRTWPQNLFKDIFSRFGHHPLEFWYQEKPKTIEGWKELEEKLIEGTRRRTEIAKWVLEKEPWDFYLICYAEPHWAGHYFWHICDPRHPEYDSDLHHACGDPVLKVYQEVDRGIDALLKIYPEATILIVSNTGMGPNFSGQHLLPEILTRLGYSGKKKPKGIHNFLPGHRWGPYYAIKNIESVIPPPLMEKIKRIIPEKVWNSVTRYILSMGNNWKNSKAFNVPSDYSAAIRINLKGREPEGKVEPGSEYDKICELITQDLKELINSETGERAVKGVVKTKELYQGELLDELQDLTVQWNLSAPINHLESKKIGKVSGVLPDKRTGAHMVNGYLLAYGKGIKSNQEFDEAHIMDVAPTIFHLLDQPVPKIMDGKILSDIFE